MSQNGTAQKPVFFQQSIVLHLNWTFLHQNDSFVHDEEFLRNLSLSEKYLSIICTFSVSIVDQRV